MATIILCGGGTAGHVIPNLALLPELRKYFDKIYYFGGNGIEEKIVEKYNIPFCKTKVIKFDRSNLFENIKIPFLLSKGIKQACDFFAKIKPDVVFSKGGYAALPACFAAKKNRIPVICHESDYTLGLANKIVSKFAFETITSFPETKGGFYIGNPIRDEFFLTDNMSIPGISPFKRTLLICGGSLGSTAINKIIYENLPKLTKKYNIIHISGKNGDFHIACENYIQYSYTDKFPSLLKACDLIICRSGSNTLCEVAALGKRCITIPLPKGASRGDQILNARSFEKRGYCDVLLQDDLNGETLLSKIEASWYKTPPISDVSQVNEKIVKHIISAL